MAVGQPLVDFWMDHCQRLNVRRITPDEAMEIIDAHRKTGHINQAFFKVATGGSMGVICNFGAIEIRDGKRVYHPEACMGCGLCVENCEQGALTLVLGKGPVLPLDIDAVRERMAE